MRFLLLLLICSSLHLSSQKSSQPKLGTRSTSLINQGGLQFKDLNKNGSLDIYEDWRQPAEARAKDLVSRMTLEEKAGFMLISTTRMAGDAVFQQGVPRSEITSGFNEEDLVQTINMFTKKPLENPTLTAAGTTKAVTQLNMRHFILRANTSVKNIAEWSNNLQALCESTRLGVPAIVASNPRNHITMDASVGLSVGITPFSKWPGELGLSAMHDYKLTREFAEIAAKEWTAVGLRKGYMYMADLATEPRWLRVEGTFGENSNHVSKLIKEVVQGFQGTKLGQTSVALTTKHFPGGGPQVRGLDSHFDFGKFAHYPGGMLDYHMKPFQAAIDAGTSAIMPYYSAPKDSKMEPVGFSYNKAIIDDVLRKKMKFRGIINSDTGPIDMMPWGVEVLTIVQRYQKALNAGVDIFSGGSDPAKLLETVRSGLISESRIDESIKRLLIEKFVLGLFENPYVDVDHAVKTVGSPAFQAKADLALRKSIVLLRNDNKTLPLKSKKKVYFESNFGNGKPPISVIMPKENKWNLEFVNTKEEADIIIAWLTPSAGSLFSNSGEELDLQLSKNKIDVTHINDLLNYKPTIVAINFTNPWVIAEIDNGKLGNLLATFGTTPDALLDVITGKFNPSGKLPFSIPSSANAVRENKSDVPGDKEPGYSLFKYGHGLKY
jgi:beta-glucosidase